MNRSGAVIYDQPYAVALCRSPDVNATDQMSLGRTRTSFLTAGLAGAMVAVALADATVAAAADPSARGAPLSDLVPATIAGAVVTALVGWVALAHRRGRTQALTRLGAFSERVSGLPRWAALPAAITGVALLIAAFGFYWDVATHIDDGRDAGPFANVSHYFIFAGLGGITLGGLVAIVLGCGGESPTAVRIGRDWHAPLGGLLVLLCGLCTLLAFPLDDVWHRIFGQDVTLWGPTHVIMVLGASLATLGVWVLLVEGDRARDGIAQPSGVIAHALLRLRDVAIAGGFLIGMSTLQGEFDFGVPQFALLFQPTMIALAAGLALVAARVRIGGGGAAAATAFYLVVLGILSLGISEGLGHLTLHFPLYVAEAALVEVTALFLRPNVRSATFGAVAGLLVGSVGTAAEWMWSHVWMPNAWGGDLVPEVIFLAPAAGVSAGVLGAAIGRALAPGTGEQLRGSRRGLVAAAAIAVFVMAFPLPRSNPTDVVARIKLNKLPGVEGKPEFSAVVKVAPASAVEDAGWFSFLAWQGGGSRMAPLERIAPGTYRTTVPIPAYGEWKSVLRIHRGRSLIAAPIFLPADTAIPAREVPALPSMERRFVPDAEILRREEVGGSPFLAAIGYGGLLTVLALWMWAMVVGIGRLGRSAATQLHAEVTTAA